MGTVLLLDDDEDLRDAVGDLTALITGQRCLCFASVAELKAGRADALACEVAILDINLGERQPSGLDAYEWLKREGFGGRITFLTGHAHSHPLVDRATALDGTRVYVKPIGIDELRQLLGVPA